MNRDNVKEFLKEYADILREGIDISDDFPLQMDVQMPVGVIVIRTKDGRRVGSICVEGDITSPSMPISPASMTYARLFTAMGKGR